MNKKAQIIPIPMFSPMLPMFMDKKTYYIMTGFYVGVISSLLIILGALIASVINPVVIDISDKVLGHIIDLNLPIYYAIPRMMIIIASPSILGALIGYIVFRVKNQ